MTSTVPQAPAGQPDGVISFILKLGRALQAVGYPSYRLEQLLASCARKLHIKAEFFVAPTSIYCGFGELERQQTFLLRTDPGDVNLGKMVDLDRVTQQVLHEEISLPAGALAIDEITNARPPYGPWLTTIAFGAASGTSARIIGGGLREIAAATIIGLLIGIFAILAERIKELSFIFVPASAVIASAAGTLLSVPFGNYGVFNATLAGLIVLMPGLTLTTALTELSTRNLVAGISRLSAALVVFMGLGVGVALGNKLGAAIVGPMQSAIPVALPRWTEFLAVGITPLAFTILLKAHGRDAIWILVSGFLAVETTRLGAGITGTELAPFVGALIVGLASRLYAQLLKRPSSVTLIPGIMLLVPGSVGFRSLAALLDKQVGPGIQTAFGMILTAMALVTGVLMSSLIVPVRER